MVDALENIWSLIENKSRLLNPPGNSVYDLFKKLNDSNVLLPLIQRTVILNILVNQTNKVVSDILSWSGNKSKIENKIGIWLDLKTGDLLPLNDLIPFRKNGTLYTKEGTTYTNYFSKMELEFSEYISEKNKNGEHVWLDLENGQVFQTK